MKKKEIADFEVLKFFLKKKVPLNRILDLRPRFKAKVLSKVVQNLNVEWRQQPKA